MTAFLVVRCGLSIVEAERVEFSLVPFLVKELNKKWIEEAKLFRWLGALIANYSGKTAKGVVKPEDIMPIEEKDDKKQVIQDLWHERLKEN